MAALCIHCTRKLQFLRISWQNSLRFLSAAANSNPSAVGYEGDNQSSSSKRDPLAVLKALASTVQPNQWLPDPEFVEDIFLLPRSRYKQKECLLAKQSGREAAEYVIKKCAWIFPLREPNPAWPVDEKLTAVLDSIQKEEDLKMAISAKNAKKAVLCCETLKEKGVEVSLETQNQLLDLVAQLLGDISAEEALIPTEENDNLTLEPVAQEHDEDDKDSDSESSDQDEDNRMTFEQDHRVQKHSWRDDNYASKLFNSMATKNGQTYEALILGLLKHRHISKAFEMFDEARAIEYQVSVWTYNSLLQAVRYHRVADGKTGVVQKLVDHMTKEPVVLPNVETYNALLRIAVETYDERSRINTAFGLIRDMFAVGIEPSLESLNELLRAAYLHHWDLKRSVKPQEKQRYFVSSAVLNEVITYLESLPKLPKLQTSQDVFFFRTAMSAAYLCMDAKLAIRLYDMVKKDDNERFLGLKQAPFYSTFLLALISAELNPYTVYEYYKEIVPDRLRPRDYVYTSLFNMAYKTNNPRIIPRLYEDMRVQRVSLTPRVAEAMFKALGRVDGPKAAKLHLSMMLDVLRWLKFFEIKVTLSILCQLIRMYCLNEKLEEAWKTLSMFPKGTAPPFSALFQVLLAAKDQGDRKKVMETFQMLADSGYTLNRKRRMSIYDEIGLTRDDRNFIDLLFRDMSVLDEKRKLQKSPSSRFNLV